MLKKKYGASLEKIITLTVTDKCDTKFLFNLENLYIGDKRAKSVMQDGNSGPDPGKTRNYSYRIENEDDTAIDSLMDLCEMNGTIELGIMPADESYIDRYDKVKFSLSNHKDVIEKALNDAIAF